MSDRRAVRVAILSFLVALACLVLTGVAQAWIDSETAGVLLLEGSMLGAGLAIATFLGRGGIQESLGDPPTGADLVLAMLVSAGTLAMAVGYVWLLEEAFASFLEEPTELVAAEPVETPLATSILLFAVLPAVVEEFLCRGVQWTALRRVAAEHETILGTAVLFALLHGLNGGFLFELPHRFLMGLALGWLRARTGGIAAPMLAHFAHNAIVTAYF